MTKVNTFIPRDTFYNCVTPAMVHGALGQRGVQMKPFTHSGVFQPVADWMQHDLRYNIVEPYVIREDVAGGGWWVEQDVDEPPKP